MSLVLHGRPGAKPKAIISQRIAILLEQLGLATPERIRLRYREQFGELVGWNTIARHLQMLVQDGKVEEQIVSRGKRRHTAVYRIRC